MKIFFKNHINTIFITISLAAFVAALLCDETFTPENNIQRYKNLVENNLRHQENQVVDLFKNDSLNAALANSKLTPQTKLHFRRLDSLSKDQDNNFTYLIFVDSVYRYWNKTECQLPTENDLNAVNSLFKDSVSLYQTNNSLYELRLRRVVLPVDDSVKPVVLCALIPIKRVYSSFEGEFLKTHFIASQDIPKEIGIEASRKTDKPNINFVRVNARENKPLLYLTYANDEKVADKTRDQMILFFLVIGFLFLGNVLNRVAQKMTAVKGGNLQSCVGFIVLLGALRSLVFFAQQYISLPTQFLKPDYYSAQQIWIEAIFFFWFAVFIGKNFYFDIDRKASDINRIILAILFMFSSVMFFNIFILVVNYLVTRLEYAVSFDNLVNINSVSVVTIASLGLILVSILIFSLRMVECIKKLQLSAMLNAVLLTETILFGGWIFSILTGIPIYIHYFLSGLFFMLLYCFEMERFNLVQLNILLLLFFALSISGLIWEFKQVKDDQSLLTNAKALLSPYDSEAATQLQKIGEDIEKNIVLPDAILNNQRKKAVVDSFIKDNEPIILKILDSDPYLNSHYDLNYLVSNKSSEIFSSGNTRDSIHFLARSKMAVPESTKPRIYKDISQGNIRYYSFAHLKTKTTDSTDVIVSIGCLRNDKVNNVLYSEIFPKFTYKGIPDLGRYSYSFFKTNDTETVFPDSIKLNKIKPGTSQFFTNNKELGLLYRGTEKKQNDVIKISIKNDAATQFKSLFGQTILIIFVLGLIVLLANKVVHFLPAPLNLLLEPVKETILSRILLPVALLLMVSYFFIFNGVESLYITVKSNDYTTETQPKIDNALHLIGEKIANVWSQNQYGDLQTVIDSIITTNTTDKSESLHFYRADGKEVTDRINVLYKNGLSSNYMDAKSYQTMHTLNKSFYENDIDLGNFKYKSIFVAVRDGKNNVLGYLENSLYSNFRKSQKDLEEARINVVFWLPVLYLITIVFIFYFINESIIKPIQTISGNLETLDITQFTGNEFIEYNQKDEIKILVNAFNKFIPELKWKLKLIEENQRYAVFRDMAARIAHDIKNPLSPINMGAQLILSLDEKFNANDFRMRTHQTMRVIIDQVKIIDRLTKDLRNFVIGTENAKNEVFDLNEAVLSTKYLMEAEFSSKNIRLNVAVPKEKIFILADIILLKRALTNLAKNGEQAIPVTTQGLINIYLEQVEDKARITISDNGTGIPEDVQEKIFNASFTTKATGSGLGLTITKQSVTALNGTIRFETRQNIGTDFILEFPIYRVDAPSSARIDDAIQPSDVQKVASRASF